MAWRASLIGMGGAALIGAGVAWTQVQPQQQEQPSPTGPTPSEVALTPDRGDRAALVQARQDPLAARLRGVLRQDNAAARVLQQIEASPVPVLGPSDPSLLRTARFYPGDRQYTLVTRSEGLIVEIFGTIRALAPPAGAALPFQTAASAADPRSFARVSRSSPAAAARAEATQRGLTDIVAEQTEYGVDVAFGRFGAAYNLTFICDAMGPPDCTEAAAIAYAASLQLLGGGDE